MSWTATVRHGLDPAPGSLALVQDLLNTRSRSCGSGYPDLLADLVTAQAWVDAATGEWSAVTGQPTPTVTLDAEGLEQLRRFRDGIGGLAADQPTVPPAVGTAALRLGEDGLVGLEPQGTGWRRLASLVLVAAYEGQRADTRRRLKICGNPRCRAAFFDRSRNNSGVWHDVKTCGNAANLRAYRARLRQGGQIPAAEGRPASAAGSASVR